MSVKQAQVSVRGKLIMVPATEIVGKTVVVMGRWLKIASVKDEEYNDGRTLESPDLFLTGLRSSGLIADIFTFAESLDGSDKTLHYPFEWDNVAVIKTADYREWWERLPQETRKNVRRASKKGVTIRTASLNDEFAQAIKRIYDESPVRQGRPFWHYGKDLEAVKRENATYLNRSELIGAYHDEELIGFMKWVYVGNAARIMQVLTLSSHNDKRPMNALMAQAVEICYQKGMKYFVYGKLTYGNKGDESMVEFKRRLGFEQINFRRYRVPLTLWGRLALKLGFHRRLTEILPTWIVRPVLAIRAYLLQRRRVGGSNQMVR